MTMNDIVIHSSARHKRIYSPLGVFSDLLIGEEKALLIDTGYGLEDLAGLIKELTSLPLMVVNTHGHVDHTCGNDQFPQGVYLHPADFALCREHTGHLRRSLVLDFAHHFPAPQGEIDVLGEKDISYEKAYRSRGEGKLLPLQEDAVFDLGGMHLSAISLPGHTQGSIGLYWEEERILFAGDAANQSVWLFLPEAGSLSAYVHSLHKAMELNPKLIYYSHEEKPTGAERLRDFLDTALDLDYEGGSAFLAPLVPGATARLCYKRGETRKDAPNIIINRDHLDKTDQK